MVGDGEEDECAVDRTAEHDGCNPGLEGELDAFGCAPKVLGMGVVSIVYGSIGGR